MRGAALALLALLAGCAGLPIARHTFLVVGIGVIRVDRTANAVGIRSISIGARIGCDGVTLGVDSSFCALLPTDGSAAILEQGSRPAEHLTIRKLAQGDTR